MPALQPERDSLLVNGGTTTSTRGRGRERRRNTFNVIAIDDQSVRVTIYRRELGARDFAPVSRHEYPRAGKAMSP